jgi:hypothetical protein
MPAARQERVEEASVSIWGCLNEERMSLEEFSDNQYGRDYEKSIMIKMG